MATPRPLLALASDCSALVDQLEVCARTARSHRNKCAKLMGAAAESRLALEAACAAAASLPAADAARLRRTVLSLCSLLAAFLERVRVYGSLSPLAKLAHAGCADSVEARFDACESDAHALTAQLWALSAAPGGGGAGALTRRRVLKARRWAPLVLLARAGGGEPLSPAALAVVGSDAHDAQLWWAPRGAVAALRAFDIALLTHRWPLGGPRAESEGVGPSDPDASGLYAWGQTACTALCADVAAGCVWTGHADGTVALWSAGSGRSRAAATRVLPPAAGRVALLAPTRRGVVWASGARSGEQAAIFVAAAADFEDGPPSSPPPHPRESFRLSASEARSAEDAGAPPLPPPLQLLAVAPLWPGGVDATLGAAVAITAANGRVWGSRAIGRSIAGWDARTGALLQTLTIPRATGAVVALMALPAPRDAPFSTVAECAVLVSVHTTGTAQLWSRSGVAMRVLAPPAPAGSKPLRAVGGALACGLVCAGLADGRLAFWASPAAQAASEPAMPVAGALSAHRCGLAHVAAIDLSASGTPASSGLATAGTSGAIALWPCAELAAACAGAPAAAAAIAAWRGQSALPSLGVTTLDAAAEVTAGDAAVLDGGSRQLSGSGAAMGLKRSSSTMSSGAPPSSTALPPRPAARMIPYSEVALRAPVGEGSYGTVYAGTWLSTEVAVKVWRGFPLPSPAEEAEDGESPTGAAAEAEGLLAEVALMTDLRHPNIVMLLGVISRPPAIVQEFCGRGSLYGVLRKHAPGAGAPPLAWRTRLHMALGAAQGMCYLHGCRPTVLHRDLKSPNLLVDRSWRCKVGDFGLSRVTAASCAVASVAAVHSPRWMAPEVLAENVHSRASDAFSFAVVLWELLTLQVPWDGCNQWQVMHAVADARQRCPFPAPGSLAPALPAELQRRFEELIAAAWAHDPRDRPSFTDLAAALQKLLDASAAAERAGAPSPRPPMPPPPEPAVVEVSPVVVLDTLVLPVRHKPAEAAERAELAAAAVEMAAEVAEPSEAAEAATSLPAPPNAPTETEARALAARRAAKARKAAAARPTATM